MKNKTIKDYLCLLNEMSVRFWPKTDKNINILKEFFGLYRELSIKDRKLISESVSVELGQKLLTLSSFIAAKIIESKDPSWIEVAIFAHVLEGFKTDYRENYLRLILVNFAINQTSTNKLSDFISSRDLFLSDDIYQNLHEFCNRPEELNDLKSTGMKLVSKNSRLKFE